MHNNKMFIVDKLVKIFKFNIILFILWCAMDNFFIFCVNFIISAEMMKDEIFAFSLDGEG